MTFDITNIDEKKLLKSLFEFATPIGIGETEFLTRKFRGENVDILTDEECNEVLNKFYASSDNESTRIIDYNKGKPMKLVFDKKHGKVIVDSSGYDSHNGKYRFLEAMIKTFPCDEIKILHKDYRPYTMNSLPKHLIKTKEQSLFFKQLLKNATQKEDNFGKYYVIHLDTALY